MRPIRLAVDCGATPATLVSVGALARMQLNALRSGARIEVENAAPALLELLDLAGLAELLAAERERKAEKGKQPGGVEEEGELDYPAVF